MKLDAQRTTEAHRPLEQFATRPVLLIAGAHIALLAALSTRYGWHRDELYYFATGKHLAWGYVDQPPITGAFAWMARELFGQSLPGLRLFAMLATATTVVLTAAIARELGGARPAQVFAALGIATSTAFLAVGHMFGTPSFDVLGWAAITLLVVRLLRTNDERLWLAIGAVVGIAFLNKHTVMFLVFGLAVGFLLTGRIRALQSRWLWAGAATAFVIALPQLIWQAQHDWPTFEMTSSLRDENSGPEAVALLLLGPLVIYSPALTPVWWRGVRHLRRDAALAAWKPVAIAWIGVLVLLLVAGGKPYYTAGLIPVLVAAGAVVIARDPPWLKRASVWVLVVGVLSMPITLPILPARMTDSAVLLGVFEESAEQVGWPDLAAQVAGIRDALPDDERAGVVIFTANYTQAGAIEMFGPEHGLPRPTSGHNTYWLWGPPDAPPSGTTIVTGYSAGFLDRFFSSCEFVGPITNDEHVDNESQGEPIHVCRGLRTGWHEIWPELRHYN